MSFCFTPRHDFLIGIDSDGCVFDTMEVKQKHFFHGLIVEHWGLQDLEGPVRQLAEHVNFHSSYRGSNRFVALLRTFELIEASEAGKDLTFLEIPALRRWIDAGGSHTNDTLADAVATYPALQSVLDWSLDVSQQISEHMPPIPPFEGVRESLAKMKDRADRVVVSLTLHGILLEEWGLHEIEDQVDVIAGLDYGTKPEQLRRAIEIGGYDVEKVILIGDAPGDLRAARETGVCFFPTLPGSEAECWKRLAESELKMFFDGTYRGEVEDRNIAAFETLLGETPIPQV